VHYLLTTFLLHHKVGGIDLNKKIVIIGAGPGGLTAGMILARNGYEVEMFEKNHHLGGRNSRMQVGDFQFDLGPTFLMLVELLEEVFQMSGRNLSDYVKLTEIEPLYRLRFHGNLDFYPSRDKKYMRDQILKHFPGDEDAYEKYLKCEMKKFNRIIDCLKIPYHKLSHMLRPQLLRSLPDLDLGKSLYDKLSEYFSHEELRISMTFQSKYLGMSPWQCPAAFTILSYIEHSRGVFHVEGGLNQISEAMGKVIKEHGGKIHLGTPVKQLIIEKKSAKGVLLENGEIIKADKVILNADFAYAMTHLVPKENRKKYTDKALDKKDYSCSTFMMYLGLDKKYDIPHHNIFFANDYNQNVSEIAIEKKLSEDPSIYVHNPSLVDKTLAPEGKSSMYILVPVPNQSSGIDWETEKDKMRSLVLRKLKEKTELTDLESHIEAEKIITPKDWETQYGVYKGATFNLSHKIFQMLYFRPHNQFEEFKNCYLVGGGTHPGSGLPTIYESGRISAKLIMNKK
jgi:phytoene desaturase